MSRKRRAQITQEIADKVLETRQIHGYTNDAIADMFGLSRSSANRIINGEWHPRKPRVEKKGQMSIDDAFNQPKPLRKDLSLKYSEVDVYNAIKATLVHVDPFAELNSIVAKSNELMVLFRKHKLNGRL